MVARVSPSGRHPLFDAVIASLRDVKFSDDLIAPDYQYRDWFAFEQPVREIPAACFGRLPASYDTALIGVALNDGRSGQAIANSHRALGAPLIVEVDEDAIGVWSVGATEAATELTGRFNIEEFSNWTRQHANSLEPTEFLRTKNIQKGRTFFFQGALFAGLIPELEERIADILEPRLTAAFAAGMEPSSEGRTPSEANVFKLAFWLLTGKVFTDRGHPKFRSFADNPDPDEVLERVADHYKEDVGRLLNRETREAVFRLIWTKMDFRNLSVEVLAQLWSRTLVTPETRARLGIHRTRKSIVDYIVNRIPFGKFDKEDRRVLEPCAGSAAFLIGAMDRMRDLDPESTSAQRHTYFKRVLRGYESDPFGVEVSRLCLALSDYPNPNHWKIEPDNVFTSDSFPKALAHSRIVLCNPPFKRFNQHDKDKHRALLWERPAELLRIVLQHLHPEGVIGFVLPRTFVNGKWYSETRNQLVRRFSDVDIIKLPDKGWEHADPETTLLIATEPKQGKAADACYAAVRERDWQAFDWYHEVGPVNCATVTPESAQESLVISELRPIWEYLAHWPKLERVAKAKRGLRWTLSLRDRFDEIVKDRPTNGYKPGIRPRVKDFCAFQVPTLAYLSVKPEHRRYKAFDLPWHLPKVIMNKVATARDRWRVAAFADFDGLLCNESLIPIWPKQSSLANALAAVLNSPVANAFLTEFSGKREFAYSLIHTIPFPNFSAEQLTAIDRLVAAYKQAADKCNDPDEFCEDAERYLKEIDATVLAAYAMPPKLERKLLDWFNGEKRSVPFKFQDYFPPNFKPFFSLKEWLTGRPIRATAARFRAQSTDVPEHILSALSLADEGDEG